MYMLCSHIYIECRTILFDRKIFFTVLDLCISSFCGCFLRRLDNCRLSAIHPCAPLAMKGAAPASSKQQMIRPNGGSLGVVCLGCQSQGFLTMGVEQPWSSERPKSERIPEATLAYTGTMFLRSACMISPSFDHGCGYMVCVTGVWQSTGKTGI